MLHGRIVRAGPVLEEWLYHEQAIGIKPLPDCGCSALFAVGIGSGVRLGGDQDSRRLPGNRVPSADWSCLEMGALGEATGGTA